MASLQMFSNEVVPEFSGIGMSNNQNVWFSQVDFNTSYPHAIPIMQNALRTALVRALTGNNNITINASNSPLPYTIFEKDKISGNITSVFCAFIAIALTMISIGIINFLLHEKQSGMKNILLLSGMNT